MLSKLCEWFGKSGWMIAPDSRTKDIKTIPLPIPQQVRIPVESCIPTVKKGDEVKVGQIIANHQQLNAVSIHASVSGRVTKIEDTLSINGLKTKEIIIDVDEMQMTDPTIQPPIINNRKGFIDAIKRAGIIHSTDEDFWIDIEEKVGFDALLINATEHELYLTTNYREIIENSERILSGILAISKQLNIEEVLIGIESINIEGIRILSEILSKERLKYRNIAIKQLPVSYPQRAVKAFTKACINRDVPLHTSTIEMGVLVLGVIEVAAISSYLETGMPFLTKRITVDGSAIREPKNVLAPIGTRVKDIIDFCGGYQEVPVKILQGGPMMGTALLNDEATISKATDAILAFGKKEARVHEESDCIRCGRCAKECPMNLMPITIDQAVRFNQIERLMTLNPLACIECGKCAFICPANRYLVQTIKMGKVALKNQHTLKT